MANNHKQNRARWLELAARMYVEEDVSLAVIHRTTGVPQTTLSRWCRQGGWDEKVRAHRSAPRTALALAEEALAAKLHELADVPAEMLDVKVISELTKLVRNIEALKRTWNPYEVALLAGGLFVKWVQANVADPAQRTAVLDVYNAFLMEVKDSGG